MNKYAEHSKARPTWEIRRCATKAKFPTEARAKRSADKHPDTPLVPYNCVMCLNWHLKTEKQ